MNKLADQYLETLYAEGLQRSEPYHPLDDPADAILDLDVRVASLEAQVETLIGQMSTLALNGLKMAERLRDAAASTAPPASAIILPDRFN